MAVKPYKILLYLFLIALLALAGFVTLLLTFDWNTARPYVNRTVSESTGRIFSIDGDLNLQLVSGYPVGSGWQACLTSLTRAPMLRISADNVHISNPTWSHVGADMASARRVVILLKPLELLNMKVAVAELDLDAPTAALERRADKSLSWVLQDNGPSPWKVQIQRLAFTNGNLHFIDDSINLDLHAQAVSIAGDPALVPDPTQPIQPNPPGRQFDLRFVLGGTYHHAPVWGTGKLGAILTLDNARTVFPVQAQMQFGANKIAFNGAITDPSAPSGIDVALTLGGASLADLYPLTGVLLPATTAYTTQGRLLGQKDHGNWNWTYQDFTGSVGASDMAGSLTYNYRLPRSMLSGAVTSNQLRLDDLGPIIGAGGNGNRQTRAALQPQPEGKILPEGKVLPEEKVLPTQPFNTAQWGALDAAVKFSGKHLIRTHDIPLENIVAEIFLEDRVLRLAPLYFGMAGGDVTSNITLDGRKSPIDAQIKMALRKLQLRELFPKLESTQASLGEINGDAALTGHGNSIAAMLASSNGALTATVSQGSVSHYILEAAGLNVANVVYVKLFGDRQVRLNCLISDFGVSQGVAEVRRFVVDTDDAVVNVTGNIDLSRELLNLDLRLKSKGMRIFSLRTPLYARGSFDNPDIGPYKGPLALRAGAALALAAVALPAAALATVNVGMAPAVDCPAELSAALQERRTEKSERTNAPAQPVNANEIQKNRKGK